MLNILKASLVSIAIVAGAAGTYYSAIFDILETELFFFCLLLYGLFCAYILTEDLWKNK